MPADPADQDHDCDWLIVGSGFGGSVAAMRLAERGERVVVLEQGDRWEDTDFAESAWETGKLFWEPALGMRGIMKMTFFQHVTVISGVGVGGGSLVYANTLYQPHSDEFYKHPQWRGLGDWRGDLEAHYREASRMLGVTEVETDGPSERIMRGLAEDLGIADRYRPTPAGVYFGEPGKRVADPYFGGAGPDRTGCLRCGQCLLGCRHGAKNTLRKNYLWFAERAGAEVRAGRRVTSVEPIGGGDGSAGYAVHSERTTALPGFGRESLRAKGVIFAGGALGTNSLLRRCADRGDLPQLSDRLGDLVRTNSEAITAATAADPDADYTADVAITASVFPDEDTHFTNNTYGGAGDVIALNFGPLTGGYERGSRVRQAARAIVARPGYWLSPKRINRWSKRTIVFTTMQSTETSLRFRRKRGPMGRVGVGLQTDAPPDAKIESYIPLANRISELAAERMDGDPQTGLTETLRGAPGTAHLLGGAVIGADPGRGVVDREHRVFGYRNMLICDGSVVPANPGVNPSLTITAMAERAMARLAASGG